MIFSIIVILLILILNLFNIRICLTYNLFHVPCPGCGCTRAIIALLKGDLEQAMMYNPLPIIIGIIFVIILLWNCMDFIKHKETFKNYFEKYKNLIVILFILLTIIVWIININNPLLY